MGSVSSVTLLTQGMRERPWAQRGTAARGASPRPGPGTPLACGVEEPPPPPARTQPKFLAMKCVAGRSPKTL